MMTESPLEPPPNAALDRLTSRARRSHTQAVLLLFASLGMALGLIGAAVALGSREEAIGRSERSGQLASEAKTEAAAASSQAVLATDAAEEANRRLAAAGKPTVPVPTITAPTQPPVQQDEFTSEEAAAVRLIVADQLSHQPVTQAEISQIARVAAALVPKPKDGKTPTAAEIQPVVTATVAAYCAGDKCVGRTGDAGPKGDPGEPGADAPKVTDEELTAAAATALTAYCATEAKPCRGKDGADSAVPGPQGLPGRGIKGIECSEPGVLKFIYSDDSTSTVRVPCTVDSPPN